MDRRFTTKELTQIRKDWIGHFPEYGQFVKNGKKMNRFDKKVGPLLVSVWLDATRKDDYRPHFSVHHLLRSAEYTSPELNTTLRKRWHITPKQRRHQPKRLHNTLPSI